jgi:hypothetical protein
LVTASKVAREPRGQAASSAYNKAQKLNVNSPWFVQSVPDTFIPFLPSTRVFVLNLSFDSAGMAFSPATPGKPA